MKFPQNVAPSQGRNLPCMSTGMIIDGVFASQAIDSSGEVLDVEGCDISTLDKDGVANYEHKEGDKKGTGNNGEEIVGRIVYAKKIFSLSDCETDREKDYWKEVGVPYVYGMVRLADGAGHSGAQALAAHIRDHHANNENILVRFSIEGSTLERKGQRLLTSVARRVALTLKPCNRTAVSGLVEDPRAPDGFDKKPTQEREVDDILSGLVEKTEKLQVLDHPAYTKLGGVHEVACSPLISDEIMTKIKLVAKAKILKALTAGSYAGTAPGALTGGSALQVEDRGLKARAMAALRDYGKKKFDKSEFKAFAKTYLPEADDSFVDHFADVAEDFHMKRLRKAEELAKKEPKKAAPAKKATAPAKKAAPTKEVISPTKEVKPKKINPKSIAAALDPKAALELATKKIHRDKKTGEETHRELKKIVVGGAELGGKELARYLGIPAPAALNLPIRGQAVQPPRPSTHIDLTTGQKKAFKATEAHFNHETGYLNVPAAPARFNMKKGKWNPGHNGGYYKMYVPGHYDPALHGTDAVAGKKKAAKELADFERLLNDPERTKYHDAAMSSWVLAHHLMQNGQTPDELVSHMTGFSQLSPNTPVPMHELMHGFLMDTIKHTGIDMRDPRFGGSRGHMLSADLKAWREGKGEKPDLSDPEKYGVFANWKARDTGDPNKLPEHAPEHWQRIKHNITLGKDQKKDPRNPDKEARKQGQVGAFMLAQNKFSNMAKYAKNHEAFHNLFLQHGPTDDQQIANHLMHHKIEGGKFDAAKDRAIEAKKNTFEYGDQQYPIDAEYPHGIVIEGLAPKTARFTTTMAGGGSMHVPDTHMNRYNFGLEKGVGGDDDSDDEDDDSIENMTGAEAKDNASIRAVKRTLWNEKNHHILNGMDRYYEKHSPAVDHMVDRWGHWLKGNTPEEKRRHAVFGAFWKNWSAIVDHEKSRGYYSSGKNDYSDHKPAWDAVNPSVLSKFPITPFLVLPNLKKGEEGYDESLPYRSAMLHSMWIQKYGEMNGHYLFMRHLLPQLLASHFIRNVGTQMRKAEALSVDLKKSLADEKQVTPSMPEGTKVMFAGHPVLPGHAITSKGDMALLHEDDDCYVAVPHKNVQDWCHHDLVKLPKDKQGSHFRVTRRPSVYVADLEK